MEALFESSTEWELIRSMAEYTKDNMTDGEIADIFITNEKEEITELVFHDSKFYDYIVGLVGIARIEKKTSGDEDEIDDDAHLDILS